MPKSEAGPQSPHWKTTAGVLLGAFIAAAGVWVSYLNYRKKAPNQPTVNVVWPKEESAHASALTIASADLHVWKHPDHFLLILPAGTTYWYEFSAVVTNAAQTAFESCTGGYEYASGGGETGRGTLFLGSWPDWYEGGAHPVFRLPQEGTSEQQFFFQGPSGKPSWLRLRIMCRQPRLEASPWY
jgi:hypothetical protein